MKKENLSKKEMETIRHIRNAMAHGKKTLSLRDLAKLLGYSSPRSANIITDNLVNKGYIKRKSDKSWQILKDLEDNPLRARTIDVPLVGSISCGLPVLAEENIEAYFPISTKLANPNNKYYLLIAKGDSMNKKGINNGNVLLVKSQQIADNGDIVIALIDDSATVKEYYKTNSCVILKPKSTNKDHKPIILHNDFNVQGIVKHVFPKSILRSH
jgi:repressor LexA